MQTSTESQQPGYEQLVADLSTLLGSYPPPFVYVNDPISPRITSLVVKSAIQSLLESMPGSNKIYFSQVDAVACFSPRILYDSIINFLASWTPRWEDGCVNWHAEGAAQRWNENFDGFVHGLRALHACLSEVVGPSTKGKGKLKATADVDETNGVRFVVVIERAERLRDALPELIVPLTRLAELTRLDLAVVFISDVRWEDIRPPLGASPDPFFIDVSPLTKDDIVQRITLKYPTTGDESEVGPYHPSLKALYSHFIRMLCDICFPFIHDPQELEYIAAARWPGFVQPVLDDHQYNKIDSSQDPVLGDERDHLGVDIDDYDSTLRPPSEDVRMRLSQIFGSSLSAAMEVLYPRLATASDWALENHPEPNLLARHPGEVSRPKPSKLKPYPSDEMSFLPRLSKFILVAAFLASTNPVKSDIRMFGRGLDEKKRKRRINKPSAKAKAGPAKIPQRLVGPTSFSLDRLIAILGALLEENDVEVRPPAPPEYTIPGEYTDMEISRTGIYLAIMELTSMRLLHRISNPDRIDGHPAFKTGVSYDVTLGLARQLDIPLNDLLWDPA